MSLEPLLAWLRTGTATAERLDFPTGTALPDGRLDLCKQDLGPDGAAQVAAALRPGVVRHLLLGTDALGDGAADIAAEAVGSEVETLYLGCNGITAGAVCRIADNLRMSPQASAVTGIWLKRNPIGDGDAAAAIIESARSLRTIDLVQTDLDADAVGRVVAAVIAARAAGRPIERLYLGGNPLGPAGATHLAALLAADAVSELYVSAAQLGDEGAHTIADAVRPGRLRRISLASNGIGPPALAAVVIAAARADVEVCDLGRVKAAKVLGAQANRLDEAATTAIAAALAEPNRLQHLVLTNTGLDSRAAHRLLDGAQRSATPTRFVLGKGIATSIRRRLDLLSAAIPERPSVSADVTAVRSVHRQPPT